MGTSNELSYKPPTEFEEVKKDPLINLNLTDSTELWLIQWPLNKHPGLDGQEVSLNLHHDGHMGSFEDSSGKSYEVVSSRAQDPEAMVFLSSETETNIVGKISRRVSLIHYPEPSELKQNSINLKHMAQRSSATTLTNSSRRFATPTQSKRSRSIHTSSNPSSRNRSSLSEAGESSKSTKRKHDDGHTKSNDQSVQDSGKGHRALTSSGSFGQSQEKKSKKKRKIDG